MTEKNKTNFCKFCGNKVDFMEEISDYYCPKCTMFQSTIATSMKGSKISQVHNDVKSRALEMTMNEEVKFNAIVDYLHSWYEKIINKILNKLDMFWFDIFGWENYLLNFKTIFITQIRSYSCYCRLLLF